MEKQILAILRIFSKGKEIEAYYCKYMGLNREGNSPESELRVTSTQFLATSSIFLFDRYFTQQVIGFDFEEFFSLSKKFPELGIFFGVLGNIPEAILRGSLFFFMFVVGFILFLFWIPVVRAIVQPSLSTDRNIFLFPISFGTLRKILQKKHWFNLLVLGKFRSSVYIFVTCISVFTFNMDDHYWTSTTIALLFFNSLYWKSYSKWVYPFVLPAVRTT